ncbi:hypothetical protein O1Q96_18395 [Streptomyces sp. Qhu-G9]|uniref:hypothetical protein n=1 Tax=Streptomyces sp. Qhu-G9 TaxID=3452799 RepID=UPI0022AC2C24|nr:hypothetical protein [Streptomyces aurantiacus]WAU81580.1 hypothetical protein O1Q96_18395 [Streptomyces aurantiacus]
MSTVVASARAIPTAVALSRSAGAAEASPIGFGGGATGGGGANVVTVSTLAAFEAAVTGVTVEAVGASGPVPLTGRAGSGSNATVLGVGSSSGCTGGGLCAKCCGHSFEPASPVVGSVASGAGAGKL